MTAKRYVTTGRGIAEVSGLEAIVDASLTADAVRVAVESFPHEIIVLAGRDSVNRAPLLHIRWSAQRFTGACAAFCRAILKELRMQIAFQLPRSQQRQFFVEGERITDGGDNAEVYHPVRLTGERTAGSVSGRCEPPQELARSALSVQPGDGVRQNCPRADDSYGIWICLRSLPYGTYLRTRIPPPRGCA